MCSGPRERTGERQHEVGTEDRSSGKRDTFICKGNFSPDSKRIKVGSSWGNSCSVITLTSDCRVILHRSYIHFPLEKNIPLAAP